jgi:hypothetical protein
MKISLGQIYFLTCLLSLTLFGQAQLVKNVDDAAKLQINEQQFVNKPLHNLLKEIDPQINMVTASPSTSNHERLGYFVFRFIDRKKFDTLCSQRKYPLQVTVFVKEPFQWDENNRQTIKKSTWTKDDVEKYGDLTVLGIRVYGKNKR